MRYPIPFLLALLLFIAACEVKQADPPLPKVTSTAAVASPSVVEGALEIAITKGDNDEFNFGTLKTASAEYLVSVSGSLLKSSGVGHEGGKVKATLGPKDMDHHVITALEKM